MPKPVATLHGKVYLASEIEEFGRAIALSSRAARTAERDLGAYFTPAEAASVMAHWAFRRSDEIVLEPSLGDGQFAGAVNRLAESRGWSRPELYACELDRPTAKRALQLGVVSPERLHIGDFLGTDKFPRPDVVIGNPPYVRIRELRSDLRQSALRAAYAALGTDMDAAGSVWMPFVAKAASLLKSKGRLAFVLPLDFTYVRYARPLWELLGSSFGRLRILRFRERIFPDILQNVLILLAEGKGRRTEHVELIARDRLRDLSANVGPGVPIKISAVLAGDRAFQEALLPAETREAIETLRPHTAPSLTRAKFNIGYVAGNKRYFHPEANIIKKFRLPPTSLIPTIASSRQLSGQGLRTSSMPHVAFLWNPANRLSAGEKRYVQWGEHEGVDMAYKCRIRKPWYLVPGVRRPDLILTTFSEVPRLHVNDAQWAISNSVLGGFLRPGEDSQSYVSSWYTPLTLLSAEIEVHSLGGGVMIAVPGEADSIRILQRESTHGIDHSDLESSLRSGDPTAPYSAGARSVLKLIGREGLEAVWRGIDCLMSWRKAQSF